MKEMETDWMEKGPEDSALVKIRSEFWRCCCFCLLALTLGTLRMLLAPRKPLGLASERDGVFGGRMLTLRRSFTDTLPLPP